MSMIPFRGKTKDMPMSTPKLPASAETVAHFEHVAKTERELVEANETIERITQEAEEREARLNASLSECKREIAFLRTELDRAAIDRDIYHTRAIASETAVSNAAAVLVESVEAGRRHAAGQTKADPPRGKEGAVDLDAGFAEIGAKFGANNRDPSGQG